MPTTRRSWSPPMAGTKALPTHGPGSATSPACSPTPTACSPIARPQRGRLEPSNSASASTSCAMHRSRSASPTLGQPCQVSATRPSGLSWTNSKTRARSDLTGPAALQPGPGRIPHLPNKCTAPVAQPAAAAISEPGPAESEPGPAASLRRSGEISAAPRGLHGLLLITLYGPPPLHVDLKFVADGDLDQRVEDGLILWQRDGAVDAAFRRSAPAWPRPDPQWIEDRFWVWVHYGAAKLGRGELFECLDMLAAVRAMVFGPLIEQSRGRRAAGVRRIEQMAPDLRSEERRVGKG